MLGNAYEIVGVVATCDIVRWPRTCTRRCTCRLWSSRTATWRFASAVRLRTSALRCGPRSRRSTKISQSLLSGRWRASSSGRSGQAAQLNAVLLNVFAGVALGVALIGLYVLVSYTVSERTQEIGIRMALGATRQDIEKLVAGVGVKAGRHRLGNRPVWRR